MANSLSAKQYALFLLSRRMLTAKELESKLIKKGFLIDEIQETIYRMQELNYQNDREILIKEFSKNNRGINLLAKKMLLRGISNDLIQEIKQTINFDDQFEGALLEFEKKQANFLKKKDPKSAAYRYLTNRGYPFAVVDKIIRNKFK